jgi:hypothetical protein
MGVARLSFGGAWRGGICRGGTACELLVGLSGLALGEGGMARPSLGVREALVFLLPGIGGLRSGAGEAMSTESTGGRKTPDEDDGGVDGGSWWSATTGR